jgi:uncharacterized membrane protein
MAPTPAPAGADEEADQDEGTGELPGVERLLTLSDGVVAIALTLLVLQLKFPALPPGHHDSALALGQELRTGAPQFTSYLISFYVIGQFWLSHHRVFRDITGHREGLAWWNFAFLLSITLMPFTSDLLGEYSDNPLAIQIFSLNLLAAGLTTQATYLFARYRGLLSRDDEPSRRTGQFRTLGLILAVALSISLAHVNTSLAKYSWLLIAFVPLVVKLLSGGFAGGFGGAGDGHDGSAPPAAPADPSG